MNRSQLCSLVVLTLLLFTPRIEASPNRRNPTAKGSRQGSPGHHRVLNPGSARAKHLEEKRRVPTGSNPLHNRR
ncbi:hypothetical protein V6N13_068638 [Hibiscus sabdariffa]|uniref:Uncharacterized protein n=1 Tax=Hibiscus sabdariffa TaxID=183260 RepID=A0ABR2QN64_9ROSI